MSANFNKVYQDSVTTVQDEYFVLNSEDDQSFAFRSFTAGAQFVDSSNAKIELFWDADGTGNNLQLVDSIYTVGETYQHSFDTNFFYTCTAASRVLIRRSVQGGNTSREIFANWQGFIL